MTFSQHGELVRNSAEDIGVYDAVEELGQERQRHAVGGQHGVVRMVCRIGHGSPGLHQRLPRHIRRDHPAPTGTGDVPPRPPATGSQIEETLVRRESQALDQVLRLVDGGEPVEADFMSQCVPFDASRQA